MRRSQPLSAAGPSSSCSPAWEAKRARSVICGGGDVKPPVDPIPAHVNWANLGDGPAGLIAELALANDVADYVRFRAACRPWRRCSSDPRAGGLDGRFFPRRWIMLDKASTAGLRCYRFFNISTGECIRMGLPELAEHRFLALSPEGLLVLLREPTLGVLLLNPLTRQLIDLPPITGLLTRDLRRARRLGQSVGVDIQVRGVGIVADVSMVVVRLKVPKLLAVAKPGSESWTVVHHGYISSTTMFADRFYCTTSSRVMMLHTSDADQPPWLRLAVESSIRFSRRAHSLHLVDNGGELLLVHRMMRCNMDPDNPYKYEVYKVDMSTGILIPVKSLNGRAVFMGTCRTISISPEAFPSLTLDTLYLGTDCGEKSMVDGYNIADGYNVRRHGDWWMRPCTLANCLSSCIEGSVGQLI